MFGDDNFESNGEKNFYESIKKEINIIFDVGCRDGNFMDFEGEVHYFDPVVDNIKHLSSLKNKNKKSFFNVFGLGEINEDIFFFPEFGSFVDRSKTVKTDSNNKVLLKVKRAKDYMLEKNIEEIDFLKIDTEGFELKVLIGFEDFLSSIKIIQFEYGGTFIDSKIKLNDIVDYLKKYDFQDFSYLTKYGKVLIEDFNDHYQYCNIVCTNKNLTK